MPSKCVSFLGSTKPESDQSPNLDKPEDESYEGIQLFATHLLAVSGALSSTETRAWSSVDGSGAAMFLSKVHIVHVFPLPPIPPSTPPLPFSSRVN